MTHDPPVTVAVDAMGGDHAPQEIVRGALLALEEFDLRVLLVGDPDALEAELPPSGRESDRLAVVSARERIGMDEAPVRALKHKKNSSIAVTMDLVRRGQAAAAVSAGSTGATLAAALFQWERIPGVDRPGIALPYPSAQGTILIIDGGANVDCRPEYLAQFALLGSVYAEQALRIPSPRVGLLNIGEEKGKGNELTQAAYPLLESMPSIRFIGNVEGRDIPAGKAHVVVCDGFVGNTILKLGEGLMEFFLQDLGVQARSQGWLDRLGEEGLREMERYFRKRCDYSERGGALLLGVQGICVIAHGSSRSWAVRNAVRVAAEAVRNKVLEGTLQAFQRHLQLGVQ